MNAPVKSTINPKEILDSGWHKEVLSQDGQRVYEAVLLRLASRGVTQMWMPDAELSRRARIALPRLQVAQSEIARSGLLFLIPGTDGKTKYEMTTAEDEGQ